MLDRRQQLAELDRLQRQSSALRRSLNGLRNGTRHVLQAAAQLDDDITALRSQINTPQPEEAQHAHTEFARH